MELLGCFHKLPLSLSVKGILFPLVVIHIDSLPTLQARSVIAALIDILTLALWLAPVTIAMLSLRTVTSNIPKRREDTEQELRALRMFHSGYVIAACVDILELALLRLDRC